LAWRVSILTVVSHGFPQSHQATAEIVLQIRPKLLPSTPFPFHCSLVIPSFSALLP